MQRNRVTVEYNYLPGQVFEHEVEGLYCVAREIDGPTPSIQLDQVLEALDIALRRWQNAGGELGQFPPHVVDHADSFQLVRPATIVFDLWPLRLSCSACGHVNVLEWQGSNANFTNRRCQRCRQGNYKQLPYYRIHSCGRRNQLFLPNCPDHGAGELLFRDTGSFYTAEFRCGVAGCGRPIDIPFQQCSCQFVPPHVNRADAAAVRASKTFTPVTAQDSRAYYGQHLTLINVAGTRLSAALQSDRGPLYALGHYVGTITDLSGLSAELSGRPAPSDAEFRQTLAVLEQVRGTLDDEAFQLLWDNQMRAFGPQEALHRTRALLDDDIVESARNDRRSMERAFLYTEHNVEDLSAVANRWRATGHSSLAARVDNGLRRAHQFGIAKVSVVRDFPIALVGYGYTRGAPDVRARLQAFDPRRDTEKLPLIAVDANTEGILVELDPNVLWAWCEANSWVTGAQPADDIEARAWVLRSMYGPESDARDSIRRITHVWSHLLIQSLAHHSSFSATSGAEYLLEHQASTLIYVARYTTFNLGGLIALAEQHLATWLAETVDGARTCVHDPVCLAERGGCHKCLALAFGCERFNRGLDRGYLVGGGTLGISEGFLYTAERLATRSAGP